MEDFGKKSEVVYPTRSLLFQHLPGSVGGKMGERETVPFWGRAKWEVEKPMKGGQRDKSTQTSSYM